MQTFSYLSCSDVHVMVCFAAADLFAIVKTTEKLERAYVRDAISAKDYEPLCEKLIAQFRTLWETLRDTVTASCPHVMKQ